MKLLALLLASMSLASMADSQTLLLMKSSRDDSTPAQATAVAPTVALPASIPADVETEVLFTAQAGETIKHLSMACVLYNAADDSFISSFSGVTTDRFGTTLADGQSVRYECSGEYDDGGAWQKTITLTGVSPPAPPTEEEQQTEVATAALVTTSQITDPFIQSMNDPAYMNYLTARVDEWTAISNYWCNTGNAGLQCTRTDQRRVGWFRVRQFFAEHLQGTSSLSKSDCAMTIMVADAEANKNLEPFFYSFLVDPTNSC